MQLESLIQQLSNHEELKAGTVSSMFCVYMTSYCDFI